MTSPHRYKVFPKSLGGHLFEVSLTVEEPDPAGQLFSMPAWIPGSYMIRDFARHVVTIRAESDGQDIELQKTDKSSWLAAPCAAPITIIAEIYAYDLSVRGAHLDTTAIEQRKIKQVNHRILIHIRPRAPIRLPAVSLQPVRDQNR